MRLTSYTDYALRALMYLGTHRDRLVTIQDIADAQGIAKNHLTKVINHLVVLGMVESVRGRSGGLRLGREPAAISIGEIVRNTENDFLIAECFDANNQSCLYSSACTLKRVLKKATNAFFDVLDATTLETILAQAGNREQRSAVGTVKFRRRQSTPEPIS